MLRLMWILEQHMLQPSALWELRMLEQHMLVPQRMLEQQLCTKGNLPFVAFWQSQALTAAGLRLV